MKESEKRVLEDAQAKFRFKKKLALSDRKIPYLVVYFENSIQIRQFRMGEWNEAIFDEIITKLKM